MSLFGEFVLFTWKPSETETGGDSLRALELPPGQYEMDVRVPAGTPNWVWEKGATLEAGGHLVQLQSFRIKTTQVRTMLPDGKVGTLRFLVSSRQQAQLPELPQVQSPVLVVGAVVAIAASMVGVGWMTRELVVEVRRLATILPDSLREPAAKILSVGFVLVATAGVLWVVNKQRAG